MPRLHLLAIVTLSLVVSCTDPPAPPAASDASADAARDDGEPPPVPDAGASDAPPPTVGFARVMVPMRDGVRLATDVARPTGADRVPAILIRTPYWSQIATSSRSGFRSSTTATRSSCRRVAASARRCPRTGCAGS